MTSSRTWNIGESRALIDHAPTMMWAAGPEARCEFVSRSWLAFTGRTRADEVGHGWLDRVHPADVESFVSIYRDHFARREGFETELRLRRADRTYRRVRTRAAVYRDSGGEFAGFVGDVIEVDLQDRGDARAAADEFFKMALDHVCVAGFDGYFKRLNPSWKRLGWTIDELLARPVIDFVHPDDREMVLDGRSRLMEGRVMGTMTNRYRCKDGSYRWFEWRSTSDVERELVYAVARDVTETKIAEEKLREADRREEELRHQLMIADRLASVGTLAAGVAHEINNPLAYVIGNLDLVHPLIEQCRAQIGDELVDDLGEMIGDARDGLDRIVRIVGGLKTYSRGGEERIEVVDLHEVVGQAIELTRNQIRHRAALLVDYGKVPWVEADEARLSQVMINLLVNAAQAIPEGRRADHQIRVATFTTADGRAAIEVQDTGEGIPPDRIDRIFEPFFTTKPVGEGTGLGLFICHKIVAELGGELTVASEEGTRTTFRVTLRGCESLEFDEATEVEFESNADTRQYCSDS